MTVRPGSLPGTREGARAGSHPRADGGLAPGPDAGVALEASSCRVFRVQPRLPFAVCVPGVPRVLCCYTRDDGGLVLSGPDRRPLDVAAGVLGVALPGAPHLLSDGPTRAQDRAGSGSVVCARIELPSTLRHFASSSHERVVGVGPRETSGVRALQALLELGLHESTRRAPGSAGIVKRVGEIMLALVVRRLGADAGPCASSLAIEQDPQLAAALGPLHAAPGRPWSLDELARRAGMSRSAFTRRFRDVCGISPGQYVAFWRMQQARRLLESGSLPASQVARRVGYASEAAFHRAFKRQHGCAPGALRRGHENTGGRMHSRSPV